LEIGDWRLEIIQSLLSKLNNLVKVYLNYVGKSQENGTIAPAIPIPFQYNLADASLQSMRQRNGRLGHKKGGRGRTEGMRDSESERRS